MSDQNKKMSPEDAALIQELRGDFIANALVEVEDWESNLLDHENEDGDGCLKELRRLIHSMKGSSQAIGLTELGATLHELENWLAEAQVSRTRAAIVTVGLAFVDALKNYLAVLSKGGDTTSQVHALRATLA